MLIVQRLFLSTLDSDRKPLTLKSLKPRVVHVVPYRPKHQAEVTYTGAGMSDAGSNIEIEVETRSSA